MLSLDTNSAGIGVTIPILGAAMFGHFGGHFEQADFVVDMDQLHSAFICGFL